MHLTTDDILDLMKYGIINKYIDISVERSYKKCYEWSSLGIDRAIGNFFKNVLL